MELSQIMHYANLLFFAIGKLGFILICFYFGSIAVKGYKGQKNILLKIIMAFAFGLISFFGGMVLKELLGLNFIFSEYLSSLIVAIICFLLISMVSTAFEVKNNYATKMDLSAIMNDLKELKIQVAKITKALEDEKISPKELDEEDIKEKLKEELKSRKISKSIISLEKSIDYWTAKLSGGKEAIIDAYTGKITQITDSKNSLSILYKKPLFTIGVILSLAFFSFLAININESAISAFEDAFDFSFLISEPMPENCVKASVLLESIQEQDLATNNSLNTSMINSKILDKTATYLIEGMTRQAAFENKTFIISVSYESIINNLGAELGDNPAENIYKARVCVLRQDYEMCECIGKEKADPLFTAPYFIKLGAISQFIQEAIMSSIAGAIGI